VRYDGNVRPHHHFICERCGAIDDLHLKAPPELARKLRRARGRTARRIQIDFYGLCESCESPRPSETRACSQGEAKCLRTKIGGRIS
jgi:Fe2+ or Zn2+ uptake regulation protein